jgi:hypothetical protein
MSQKLKLFFSFLLFGNTLLFARTREEVIADGIVYSDFSWSISQRNILDVFDQVNNSTVPLTALPRGSDGIDDRFFTWNAKATPPRWEYKKSNWPFVVGESVTGEAYAFGLWDTTTTYTTKLSANKIAGARANDTDANSDRILDTGAEDRFTGIDCSGFVARVWGITSTKIRDKPGTPTLATNNYALLIATEDLKSGDILLRTGAHVIVVNEIYISSVNVIHATPNKFSSGDKVQRVSTETIRIISSKRNSLELRDETYKGEFKYSAYSAFPQFKWISTTDTIRVEIRSGTRISTDSIKLILDYDTTSQIEIGLRENSFI